MQTNWKKNTALFLTGQAVSVFGSMTVQFAIFWYVTLETRSGSMMMVFTIVSFLPMFLISPFGGVWTDRLDRKRLLAVSDGVIAAVSLIMALLLLLGRADFEFLLVCAGIRALGQGIQTPAVSAVVQQLVPKERLTRVNGIQSSVLSLCNLAAPAVSGVLMSVFPLEAMFFLDVGTAIIGIGILIFFVKIPRLASSVQVDGGGKRPGYFHDLKEGVRYIRGHGFVHRLIVFLAVFHVFIAPVALLTPLQVVRNFGGAAGGYRGDVWLLTAIEIAFSLGMIAGGLLIAVWCGFRNRIYTMALSCLLTGLTTAALGVTPYLWLYIGIMALSGVTVPMFSTPTMVILQSKVEPEFMGRVQSVFAMVSSSAMPLAMLIFGPLADRVNIDFLLIGTGAALSLMCVLLVVSKTLRRAGES